MILLPPSETKAAGGTAPPLALDELSFPSLEPVRRKLIDSAVELASDVPAARRALKLSAGQDAEIARNASLWSSPCLPALSRYTGVLYDALDAASMTRAERARAGSRLVVASALFGLVRGDDLIPAYRLSGGSVLPAVGPLPALWRPALAPLLTTDDVVIDLRSSVYAALAPLPNAISVRVVTSSGAIVSHFNKATKGRLARAVATARTVPATLRGLIGVAARAGLTATATGKRSLDVLATQ